MSSQPETTRRLTVADIARRHADGERIPMLTAYDFPTAKLLDEAGIPLLLVGDSLGRAMLGYENEIPVSMADMLHHTAAVTRGAKRALVIGDLPFLTYPTVDQAVANAGRFLVRGRRPGRQARGRRAQRPDDRSRGQGRHPGHGPHRLDAPGRQRGRQGPRPWARTRPRPAPCSPTPSRSRRPAPSPSCSSSSRSSWRPRSPSACASRRSASAPAPAAAARSRSSPTCSGSDAWHPRHARPYADLRGTILEAAAAYAADVEAGHVPRRRADRPDGRRGPRRGPRPDRPRPRRRRDPGGRDPARPRPLRPHRRRRVRTRAELRAALAAVAPPGRPRPDDGLAARGPPRADPARASRERDGRRHDLRQPAPVQRGGRLHAVPAQRGARRRASRASRGRRPHLGAAGRGGLPAGLRHDRRGRGRRAAARGRGAARSLRRGRDGRRHPVQPRRRGAGVLRPEGRPAGHGHPPDGPRPGHRHGGRRLPDRPRGGRPGAARRATSTSRRRSGPRPRSCAARCSRRARRSLRASDPARSCARRCATILATRAARRRRVRVGGGRPDAGRARRGRRAGARLAGRPVRDDPAHRQRAPRSVAGNRIRRTRCRTATGTSRTRLDVRCPDDPPSLLASLLLLLATGRRRPARPRSGMLRAASTRRSRADAEPGSTLVVGWTTFQPGADGAEHRRSPARPSSSRLTAPGAAEPTALVFGDEYPAGSGHFTASIVVPPGGIAPGWRVDRPARDESCEGQVCQRSDLLLRARRRGARSRS